MATATATPDPVLDLARRFAALCEETKELAKSRNVIVIWEALAGHLRSAAPMVLIPMPELPVSTDDALIDLGEGRVIRLRVIDGKLNVHVFESAAHDASVALDETKRAELIAALGVVR